MSVITSQTVEDAIFLGTLDADLSKIADAIRSRQSAVRASKTATDFGIGDAVRFNDQCGTRYLIGHTARVVGMKRTKIVVKLDKPTGRFARVTPSGVVSADITVPIQIVDLV